MPPNFDWDRVEPILSAEAGKPIYITGVVNEHGWLWADDHVEIRLGAGGSSLPGTDVGLGWKNQTAQAPHMASVQQLNSLSREGF